MKLSGSRSDIKRSKRKALLTCKHTFFLLSGTIRFRCCFHFFPPNRTQPFLPSKKTEDLWISRSSLRLLHQPHGLISHWVGNLSIMQIALVGLPHGYCVNQSNKIPLVINILFIISSVKNPTNTVSLPVNWPLKTTWSVNLKKVGGNT